MDPKLQNNKKLPKWNRRARIGQFLGFSRYHSSTVALVWNLHTGFISPQYHVVFDDKFETVFGGSMSEEELDRICQRLFDGDRENYVEEEFDDDGVLIYEPPPLDKVWLTEPERRDRRTGCNGSDASHSGGRSSGPKKSSRKSSMILCRN